MTPHEALESFNKIENSLGSKVYRAFDQNGWMFSKLMLELQPVHFHFGTITPARAHLDFAEQLFDNEVFRLPYPYMFITNDTSPNSALLCYQEWDGAIKAKLVQDKLLDEDDWIIENSLSIVTLGPFCIGSTEDSTDLGPSNTPFGKSLYDAPACPLLMTFFDGGRNGEIRWRSLSLKGTRFINKKGGVFNNEEKLGQLSQTAFQLTIGYVTLLMSKDINQQIFPTPDRLNKRRLQKKKPPIGERRVITVKSNIMAAHHNVGDLKSGRKSPIMHWRRGHIRRLGNRIVPIAPMIINARDDSIPEPKTYKFKPE